MNGLDANRDVTVLSLGVMPTIFAGLQSGIVECGKAFAAGDLQGSRGGLS